MLDLSNEKAVWFEQMLDIKHMSASYKIFWLKGILNEVCNNGAKAISFDRIVCHMIAEAWYPIVQFKLNFGIQDKLGRIVDYLENNYHYGSDISKVELLHKLIYNDELKEDKLFQRLKKSFYNNVPYRLISPFFRSEIKGKKGNGVHKYIVNNALLNKKCIYYIDDTVKAIILEQQWMNYIIKNQAILFGWLQNKLVRYLQKRNPNVPNIIMKLEPPTSRHHSKGTKYWKKFSMHNTIVDIYSMIPLNDESHPKLGSFSIDHFIPWSFVLHDELWNLVPTFKHINSSKSDCLPRLDKHLEAFCHLQYEAFIYTKDVLKNTKILEDYLNIGGYFCSEQVLNENVEVQRGPFEETLKSAIKPIYQIARNQGYEIWEYH